MDIQGLLEAGESGTVEFKTTFGKEVIISLSAFANTKGGKVIVGVDRSVKPTGIVVSPETEQRYLNEIKTATYPQIIPHISLHAIDDKNVLVFEIHMELGEIGDFFRVALLSPALKEWSADQEKQGGKPEKLPELPRLIIEQMLANPKVTYLQLTRVTGKSKETIRKNIQRLRRIGLVRRIGPAKGGHWQVTLTEE